MSKPWYRQPKLCLVGSPAFALLAEATPQGPPPARRDFFFADEEEQEVWANLLLLSSHGGRRFATSFEMQASHVYMEA